MFEGTEVNFHYPEDLAGFNILIENFRREDIVNDDDNSNENIFWGKKNSADLLSKTTSQVLLTGLMNLAAF